MAYTTLEVVKTYAASFATLFGTPQLPSRSQPVPPPSDDRQSKVVLLNPARRSGARLVLLPLLPPPKAKVDLPSELWGRCLHFAMDLNREKATLSSERYGKLLHSRRNLLLVNKKFRDLAAPILYAEIRIYSLKSLESLENAVLSGERRWDNLRRIPHSTPGRWIQSLDISTISSDLGSRSTKFRADTCICSIIQLSPFITRFTSDPKLVLSARVMKSLADHCPRLQIIKGLQAAEDWMSIPTSPWLLQRDPVVSLVRACAGSLEVLEVIGSGATQDEDTVLARIQQHDLKFPSLVLPKLHTLTLSGVPCSPIFYTLRDSTLISLTRLTITIYPSRHSRDMQSSSAAFLAAHGGTLESLILPTPPDWPPPDYVGTFQAPAEGTPTFLEHSILHLCPKLTRLNLSFPLPPLLLVPNPDSPLRTILFPRPLPALLPFVTEMASRLPSAGTSPPSQSPLQLQGHYRMGSPPPPPSGLEIKGGNLKKVVWTKSRWLRSDVGSASRMARTAGDQAEMLKWKRVLSKVGVVVLDADGRGA